MTALLLTTITSRVVLYEMKSLYKEERKKWILKIHECNQIQFFRRENLQFILSTS